MPAINTMSCDQLRVEMDRCLSGIGECEEILSGLRVRLDACQKELARRTTPTPKPHVTAHAMLRFLERVKGIDLEATRREILSPAVISAMAMGASGIQVDGLRLCLVGNSVKTVIAETGTGRKSAKKRRVVN